MLKSDINDGSEEVDRRAVGFLPLLQTVKDTTIAAYKSSHMPPMKDTLNEHYYCY